MLDIEMDSDGDGCADVEELGTDPLFGGGRDPANPWDFYDVNANEKVDGMDIGLVRANFTPHGPVAADDTVYDRSPGSSMWAPGPADDRINAIDIALVRASFWHSCAAPS